MNTKEVAEYLRIHEKQVYALIKTGTLPGTRVTGKWLFPKHIIDRWINESAAKGLKEVREKTKGTNGALLAVGSNDPVLDILLSYLKQIHSHLNIFSCSTGSLNGLEMLQKGQADLSWSHLLDINSGEYNLSFIKKNFANKKIEIVHLFYRELGFIFSSQIDKSFKSFPDLLSPKVKFINRQEGSGTRLFLDHQLKKEKISAKKIKGYNNSVYTHLEVGLAILSGEANVGLATVAIAKLLGLNFIPLVQESFDMVLAQETFFNKGVQDFIKTLNSTEFKNKIKSLGNYDFSQSGTIV